MFMANYYNYVVKKITYVASLHPPSLFASLPLSVQDLLNDCRLVWENTKVSLR